MDWEMVCIGWGQEWKQGKQLRLLHQSRPEMVATWTEVVVGERKMEKFHIYFGETGRFADIFNLENEQKEVIKNNTYVFGLNIWVNNDVNWGKGKKEEVGSMLS